MKVVVFGAGGKTGELIVDRAIRAGHTVTAFVHDAEKFEQPETTAHANLAIGDVNDPRMVSAAVKGQDAVIDAIGGKTPYKDTDLERKAAATILAAMEEHSVRRLIAISMLGIGDSKQQAPFWYAHLMQPTFLRGATKDKEAMEAEVRASGVDFVLVRPPLLTDGEATGSTTVIEGDTTGHKITRADLAQFIVNQLEDGAYLHQAVTVVNS